jgi:L-threonylcarbamoyladenylate synthase
MVISIEREGPEIARRELERCVAAGGLAIFPADTLYGLACDPTDATAIGRINALKGRDAGKSSAVMFFAPLAMREVVSSLGPRTREALARLLPGAVTAVVANPQRRYPLACREDPERLGLRLIDGPLGGAGCAVFQTSANVSGASAPSRFDDLDAGILQGVDLAIDAGELGGEPSTVVDIADIERDGPWQILREGALSAEELSSRLSALPR